MKRKSAIKRILGIGFVAAGAASVYEVGSWYKTPDLKHLGLKKNLIADLAELIIPQTDTPGAKDARTEEYIIHAVTFIIPYYEANTFIEGLEQLEQDSHKKYKQPFSKCSNGQQRELLLKMKQGVFYSKWRLLSKVKRKLLGRSFFEIIKDLTVTGYCTSEAGATKGLAYIDIPGHFNPCIPLEKGQRCWATK
ncbi:MAG: gluconate 2-dehydrogenase subunit 3 family protein [Niabella sp.]